MPTYDYLCRSCGHRVEVVHGIHSHGPASCPVCGAPMRKAISAPTIHFKGSGWAKKDRTPTPSTKAAAKAGAGGDDHGSSGDHGSGGDHDGSGGDDRGSVDDRPSSSDDRAAGRSSDTTSPTPAAASSGQPTAPKPAGKAAASSSKRGAG